MYTEVDKFLKGYTDEHGVTHQEFEYREMTGEDEEAMSKPKVKGNGAIVTRVLLDRCIVRIGTIEKKDVKPKVWEDIIQSLAIGDQDYAMVKIREISLGDEYSVSHKCPHCKTKIDSIFTVDELPLVPYDGQDKIEFELPKGYTDKDGVVHTHGVLRHATGLDREILGKMVTQNPSVANTLLLARCIESIGNVPLTDNVFRKLSLRDRNFLYKLISENSFGFDLTNLEIECPNCGRDLTITFNQTDFL